MKILNFGSCNIDYVYSLDHIVKPGETETTYGLELFPGGKGLNQAIAVAKAGAEVYFAGCVGEGSDMLTDIMKDNSVNISLINKLEQKNGHAIIQVNSEGENSIFLYPGTNEMVSKDYIDKVLNFFDDGDIILLQNEISNIDYIVEKAYEKNMCIIFNPSPINEKINSIDFSLISYVILNEVEAKAISGCGDITNSLKYIKSKYPNLKIILTMGKKGCIYTDNKQDYAQSAFKANAIDTTAAGDTFAGYFVAGISIRTNLQTVLRTASAASAISVSRKGAASSIPNKEEVLIELDNMIEYI